jgi:lipopolysaccharide/colanic/teichoic acid biosynthesis glycosyltransferase
MDADEVRSVREESGTMVRDHVTLRGSARAPTRASGNLRAATTGVPRKAATAAKRSEQVVYELHAPHLSPAYRIAKRGLDIAVSLSLLVVLSPLLALTALLVVVTSRGPALFRQQRVGEGGRIFTIYKFRSMYQDADHTLHQIAYAHFVQGRGGNGKVDRRALKLAGLDVSDAEEVLIDGMPRHVTWVRRQLHRLRPLLRAEDPRITPFGALLRVTSIDELPQLFNVLIGDMTLVGPRPPIPYEVRLYQRKHLQRLTVRPGVTGIWQVYGRNKVPFEEMVDMDIMYIKRRSFWLDLKLLVLTVPAVILSRAK